MTYLAADCYADLAHRDGAVPGLPILFEAARLAQMLESRSGTHLTDLVPVYLRYKAGTSCLAAYRAQGPQGRSILYARAFRRSASDKFEKAARGCAVTSFGGGPLVFPEDRVIVRAFPDDARLRYLCRSFDLDGRDLLFRRAPAGLRGPAAALRTLAYRPERRFVAEVHAGAAVPAAVLKMYTRAAYGQAAARTRIAASREVLRVPRRLARDSRRHVLFLEWLPGRTASELAHGGERLDDHAALVGQALAELHLQPVDASTPRSLAYDRRGVARVLEDVAFVFPALAGAIQHLRDLVDVVLAERYVPALVHGDLHLRQILLSPQGVGFVDFDRAGAGPSAGDLACCLAHLERDILTGDLDAPRACEMAEQLLAGYARLKTPPAPRMLRVFTAAALGRLLPEPFRQCRSDAADLTARMLDRAIALAEEDETGVVP